MRQSKAYALWRTRKKLFKIFFFRNFIFQSSWVHARSTYLSKKKFNLKFFFKFFGNLKLAHRHACKKSSEKMFFQKIYFLSFSDALAKRAKKLNPRRTQVWPTGSNFDIFNNHLLYFNFSLQLDSLKSI